MLIYLVRHAQTRMIPNAPSAEWSLSALGQEQADLVAGLGFWSDVERVYSSPEPKALATVGPAVARHALPVCRLDGLRELERPLGDIMSQTEYADTAAACFANPSVSVRGWEPADQARQRMIDAIRQVAAEQGPAGGRHRSAAIVSHGLVLALFVASLNGRSAPSVTEWRSIPMPGWAVLDSVNWELVHPFHAVL